MAQAILFYFCYCEGIRPDGSAQDEMLIPKELYYILQIPDHECQDGK